MQLACREVAQCVRGALNRALTRTKQHRAHEQSHRIEVNLNNHKEFFFKKKKEKKQRKNNQKEKIFVRSTIFFFDNILISVFDFVVAFCFCFCFYLQEQLFEVVLLFPLEQRLDWLVAFAIENALALVRKVDRRKANCHSRIHLLQTQTSIPTATKELEK